MACSLTSESTHLTRMLTRHGETWGTSQTREIDRETERCPTGPAQLHAARPRRAGESLCYNKHYSLSRRVGRCVVRLRLSYLCRCVEPT